MRNFGFYYASDRAFGLPSLGVQQVAIDVKLEPGWLIRDVRKASEKVKEWSKSRTTDSARELTRKDRLPGHSAISRKETGKGR